MKNLFKKIIVPIITWQAMHVIGRFQPKIIAVTGSVGKTSTKDAIYTFIKDEFDVRKSEKSFNSEIGVPLTILGIKNAWLNPVKWGFNLIKGFFIAFFSKKYPAVLVLEIGADKPGDIENIVDWLKPDIAVVTALADVPVHVENFGEPEDIYREKSFLVRALGKDGVAVLNEDDARIIAMQKLTPARICTFGMKDIEKISLSSSSNPYPLLAAAAVAAVLGVKPEKIKKLSGKIETAAGRLKVLPGIHQSIIIDDTYNSSPIAAEFALKTLKTYVAGGAKIAVLGDMAELGKYSETEHKRIGVLAKESSDMFISVGPKSKSMEADKHFENSVEAGKFLATQVKEGDVVLVKGSQSMRMEKAVLHILADPEHNSKLLPRQDNEWIDR